MALFSQFLMKTAMLTIALCALASVHAAQTVTTKVKKIDRAELEAALPSVLMDKLCAVEFLGDLV